MNKTFIIAEAGANHDGDYDQALKLIDIAVEAGCDAVKFQTYSADTLYSKKTPNFAGYKDVHKLIQSLELPREWQKDLKKYCDDTGIEFMSTPFDERAVDELYDLGIKRFKIAGFEAKDPRLIKYVAKTGLPMVVSAGIGVDLVSIQHIINWITEENNNPDITFLHCNNAYPTPFEDICLLQIKRIQNTKYTLPIKIGLSDHTRGILVPPLAVALGATVVEKHYTLDRGLSGPDHSFAIEPDELAQMVNNIRIAESCLQTKSSMTDSEKKFANAMRSVVTKKGIKKGERITLENITTKRPAISNCVGAFNYYALINNKYRVTSDLEEDSILLWENIEIIYD